MTDPTPELTPTRVSSGRISPRLVALVVIVAMGGVIYVGATGRSGSTPPAPHRPAATDEAALPTPVPIASGAPEANSAVAQLAPDGRSPWQQGLGIELSVNDHLYPGQLFEVGDGHFAAVYSVPDELLGEWTTLSLTRDFDGTAESPAPVASWDFTMYAAPDRPPPMLIDQDIVFDPTDPANLELFQAGFHMAVRLAPAASAEHMLLIDVTAYPAPQPPIYRYAVATTIVGGALRVALEPDDGNSYLGRFELNVGDIIGRKINIQVGRGRSRYGLEVFEPFGFWQVKLKALRGSKGKPVPLIIEHAPPNVMQGVAPDDLERVGYTVALMGRRDGDRLTFSVELVIGGLVAPQADQGV